MKYIKAAETEWERFNPILAEDEVGLITGTNYYVQGDGETQFNDLDRLPLSDGPSSPVGDMDLDEIRDALDADFIGQNEQVSDSQIPSTIARDIETDGKYVYTLAYAEDISGTSIPLTANQFTPSYLTLSVPPTTRDVCLSYGGAITVTVAGPGTINLGVMDVTSGSVTLYSGNVSNTGSLTAGVFSAANYMGGQVTVPASNSWRIFRLYAFLGRDSGSLAGNLASSATTPYPAKSWMKAELQ